MTENKRNASQRAADGRYEPKRAGAPRFGGRCSEDEKELLTRLASEEGLSEKELIFKTLRYFEENR
ncbi:hypothetical protein [Shewanella algae]|jgi:hypothetical protein|uniref:hypothetical protein n=1 Tax=Shewanella algae TaxID=38313 RepID=UPI0011824820|nr:hypothetical protein [Shewanella algae]MBO2558920.1 hypothetical protein [Shewanella algae]MBO2575927.1 hypothetical protein [Shewanella algae]TVO81281.1 hypothetical protein AYI80_21335 [Shewanella algae]TXS81973.1 hypothetical protein AYI81_21280 [Shewanella algae]